MRAGFPSPPGTQGVPSDAYVVRWNLFIWLLLNILALQGGGAPCYDNYAVLEGSLRRQRRQRDVIVWLVEMRQEEDVEKFQLVDGHSLLDGE